MHIHEYAGTYEEVGRQVGNFYASTPQTEDDGSITIDQKLFAKQKAIYTQHYPSYLVQMTATAEAAKIDTDIFTYTGMCRIIELHKQHQQALKGCTIVGLQNKDGSYVARNYDWLPGAEQYVRVIKYSIQGQNTYFGISDMDFARTKTGAISHPYYAIEDAINDKGLYIGLTFAHHSDTGYGLSPIHMIQLVAESCATVEEALSMFEEVPISVPKNFFIADATGAMAVVEHTGKQHRILRPVDGILIQTNHFQHPDLAPSDGVRIATPHTNSFKRYADTLERLTHNKNHIHQLGLANILRDQQSVMYEHNNKYHTVWTLSLDLQQKVHRFYSYADDRSTEQPLRF